MSALPRVALFYDVPDWAFHNVARNVARVTDGWVFDLYGRADWFGRQTVIQSIMERSDLLVFLWRFDLLAFLDCLQGPSWRRMTAPDRPGLATVVYDHLYDTHGALADVGDPFILSDAVGGCSDRLRRHYQGQRGLPDISFILPDGVDTSMFGPGDMVTRDSKPLTVGWVGNSQWAGSLGNDLKGRRTIFEPAVSQLQARGFDVEPLIIDAADHRKPHSQMPDLYRQMDVLVCTSAIEGTPNPVLEAMATGTSVVSTDVGIVPDVFGPKQSEFIVKRDPTSVASAIERLVREPGTRAMLAKENAVRRRAIDWQTRAAVWQDFMTSALEAARSDAGLARTQAILDRRKNAKSPIERARRLVASNALAYRLYEFARLRTPGLFRQTRRLLSRTTE